MDGQSKSERVCRLCGQGGEASPIGLVSNSYPLLACRSCEGVLVESKPSDEDLQRLYDEAFSNGMYEANRREFEALRKGSVPRSHYREKLLHKARQFTSGKSIVE